MSELAVFQAITFTGTFGPLLWEKFYPVKGNQQTVEIDSHAVAVEKDKVAIGHLPHPIRVTVLKQFTSRRARDSMLQGNVAVFSLYNNFWALNFCGFKQPRKIFNDENFLIYGMCHVR